MTGSTGTFRSGVWKHLKYLHDKGTLVSPRGQKTLELRNVSMNLKPRDCWMNFPARNLNLDYIKKELSWYLYCDWDDTSIAEHAFIWRKIMKENDGVLHSNYGAHLLNPLNEDCGLHWVIKELKSDPYSRRAVTHINQPEHLYVGNADIPCTMYMIFNVVDEVQLDMGVRMRSNDAIFGLGNDLPAFHMFHQIVAAALNLELGNYNHFVDSLHVYERHFGMLENIIADGPMCQSVDMPRITHCEAMGILDGEFYEDEEFTRWVGILQD